MDVRLPSGQIIRGVPDGISKSDLRMKLLKNGIDPDGPAPAVDPTEGMSAGKQFLAGIGKSFVDTGRGLGQMVGTVSQEQVDEARRLDAPLTETGAGFAGNLVGSGAQVLAPGGALLRAGKAANSARLMAAGRSALAPQTFRGAAAQGAGFAATQPVASDESRIVNALTGAAGGAAGHGLTRMVGAAVRPRQVGLNDQQKRVLGEAEELGFRALPSQRTGSGSLRVLEAGLGRTIGGAGAFTNVAKHNQTLTNQLAAKELGRQSDTVTRELLDDVQSELGKKYDALRSVKQVKIGKGFRQEVASILKEQAERPEVLQDPDVVRLVAGLAKTKEMTGAGFIAATKALRKQSRDAFRAGKSEVGQAKRSLAEALEEHASPRGASPGAIVDFKKARHKYSKLLAIEGAANERGDVSAAKLAQALKKSNPKRYGNLSNDLEKAAAFEKLFPPIQSSGTVEGAQIGATIAATIADPSLGLATIAGPAVASRVYASKAGGAVAEAPIRALQGTARMAQALNPVTPKQKMIAEMLRRGTVLGGSALPAAINN